MQTNKKYTDKEEAIKKAKEYSVSLDAAIDVVYCHRTEGYYLDKSPAMIRNWEELIGTYPE